jgi:O-antigen ligase
MRLRILPTVQEITQAFWPWGSGLGSFEKIYQVFEPAHLLAPSYMNHAHNDWLELILTGGLPSLVLVALGVLIWLSCAVKLVFGRAADPLSPLRKAGLVIVLILALASLTDYPLRTPALSCLLVLASVWAAMPVQRPGDKPAADKGA